MNLECRIIKWILITPERVSLLLSDIDMLLYEPVEIDQWTACNNQVV